MTHSHTYQQCYKLLNVDEHCSTEEVKRSYKRLIQKWHPDRYETDNEKEIATQRITSITTAYKQLSDYHRKNGCFPDIQPTNSPTPHVRVQPHQYQEPPKQNVNEPPGNSVHQSQSETTTKTTGSAFFRVVAVIMIFVLGYSFLPEETAKDHPPLHDKNKTKKASSKPDKKKISSKKTVKKKAYFTYGSRLADVILVQGPPDKMEGNIWYYGKSEIHFKDGAVVYWFRDSKTPLNAQVTLPKY